MSKDERTNYKVQKDGARWVISDEDGNIIDDAQGYRYKTKEKANKALWYKFKGGKHKAKNKKNEAKKWKKENKEAYNELVHLFELNFKEIARGEVTDDEIYNKVEEDFNVQIPQSVKNESF